MCDPAAAVCVRLFFGCGWKYGWPDWRLLSTGKFQWDLTHYQTQQRYKFVLGYTSGKSSPTLNIILILWNTFCMANGSIYIICFHQGELQDKSYLTSQNSECVITFHPFLGVVMDFQTSWIFMSVIIFLFQRWSQWTWRRCDRTSNTYVWKTAMKW